METERGTIVIILNRKNYGFIRRHDGTEIFFHRMGVVSPDFKDLREGMEVDFIAVEDKDGKYRAIGVVAV